MDQERVPRVFVDDWEYATEPIPGDRTWAKEKALEGPVD
jgi:hypothetical protein